MDSWSILLSVLLGAIGFGYVVYGRKQMHAIALISGILLCIFPYFIANIWLTLLIAGLLMLLPRVINL